LRTAKAASLGSQGPCQNITTTGTAATTKLKTDASLHAGNGLKKNIRALDSRVIPFRQQDRRAFDTSYQFRIYFDFILLLLFFFCAPWAYYTVFSGAGVVSGTLHPAV
jgi:hypothetical protein